MAVSPTTLVPSECWPTMFHTDHKAFKKALKEFDRTEKMFEEDVHTVQKWMESQPHLPEIMDEAKIRNFLLINKCSVERVKQKIDMYYTVRSLMPEMYSECNPKCPNMQMNMETVYCCTHSALTKESHRLIFFKINEPNKLFIKELIMQLINLSELRLSEDCILGDVTVVDCQNLSFSDFTKLTPSFLAKVMTIFDKVYSFRNKKTYFINSPSYMNTFMVMLKPLLKPKLYERYKMCQDAEIMKELLPEDTLPKDYGGKGPSLKELNELLKSKLKEYERRFDDLDTLRVDESLRPQKLSNHEMLGFHGNFRKLNID